MPDPTIARQQRAARNQVTFREVNERLQDLNDRRIGEELHEFVCECADFECIDAIELTLGEYERVRGGGATFAVTPGHIEPGVERVTLERAGYVVVEKIEAAAELARAHDPRAGDDRGFSDGR